MDKRAPDIVAEWDNETLKFRWSKVNGAKCYILSVRNVANPDRLLIKTEVPGSKAVFSKKMDEDLKYGQTCEVMLKVIGLAYDEIETQWRRCIIGGPEVPRNLKAITDFDDPQRSVKISWDAPEERPTSYEVVSIPQNGKRRMLTCNDTSATFPRLKRSTRYQFMVMAVYIASSTTRKSFGCKTNFISTYTKENTVPTVQFSTISGAKLNLVNRAFPTPGNNQVNNTKPELSDKPQNLEMLMATEEGELEMGQIFWHHPTFSGKPDDYEISQYQVIVKEDDKILPYSPTFSPATVQTEKFIINLGKRYTVLLRTTYEELDTEKVSVSESREDFYSKPALPKIDCKEEEELVEISWQSASGATEYKLQVFNSSTDKLVLAKDGGKIFLREVLKIDDQLFRGRSYTATVTALGKSSRNNSAKIHMTIGGDRVPRMPQAIVNNDQPSTAIDLSWDEPYEKAQSYVVEMDSNRKSSTTTKTTSCTMHGLDPATAYKFIVFGVFNGQREPHGCLTDEINTHPDLGQISSLEISQDGDNPDTCIHVRWSESSGCQNYKVAIKTRNFLLEHITEDNNLQIDGLRPNTHYEVSLSAGSNNTWSEVSSQSYSTGLAAPKDVKLTCDRCDTIRLNFNGSMDGSCCASLYEKNGELVKEVVCTKSPCIFENLNGNTQYFVKMRSHVGNKFSKQVESNLILTTPAPVKFTDVKLSASHPTMDIGLKWEDDGCNDYEIEISSDGKIERKFMIEGESSCTYRCLKEGGTYQVIICARNASGCGTWSPKKEITLDKP